MPSPGRVPAHAARRSKPTSSAWRSWKSIADGFKGVQKAYAIQAGREIRVMVQPEEVEDSYGEILASEIARKIEKELEYPGQIKVMVIRETRAINYAK